MVLATEGPGGQPGLYDRLPVVGDVRGAPGRDGAVGCYRTCARTEGGTTRRDNHQTTSGKFDVVRGGD